MLTILPESKTRVILLASRAIYSCIPRKRAIQYYYYYSYRALCVNLLSNDRGWLPAAILSSHESESLWDVATVTKVGGAKRDSQLNDWSHKVRAILKKYCPGNIQKILPSSQTAVNTRFYFGHQKLCMDNNKQYCSLLIHIGTQKDNKAWTLNKYLRFTKSINHSLRT